MKAGKAKLQYPGTPPEETIKTDGVLKKWIKDNLFTVILVAVLIVGVCLLIYPSFATVSA